MDGFVFARTKKSSGGNRTNGTMTHVFHLRSLLQRDGRSFRADAEEHCALSAARGRKRELIFRGVRRAQQHRQQRARRRPYNHLAMAYIVAVNPPLLEAAGIPYQAALTATCLGAAAMTAVMGLVANRPIALASGMGINAIIPFTLCMGEHAVDWRVAMAVVFVEGVDCHYRSLRLENGRNGRHSGEPSPCDSHRHRLVRRVHRLAGKRLGRIERIHASCAGRCPFPDGSCCAVLDSLRCCAAGSQGQRRFCLFPSCWRRLSAYRSALTSLHAMERRA